MGDIFLKKFTGQHIFSMIDVRPEISVDEERNIILQKVDFYRSQKFDKLPPISMIYNSLFPLPSINYDELPVIEKKRKSEVTYVTKKKVKLFHVPFLHLSTQAQVLLQKKIRSVIYDLKFDKKYEIKFNPSTFGNECIIFSQSVQNVDMSVHVISKAIHIIKRFIDHHQIYLNDDDRMSLSHNDNLVKINKIYNHLYLPNIIELKNNVIAKMNEFYPQMDKYKNEIDRYYFAKNSTSSEVVRLLVATIMIGKKYSIEININKFDRKYVPQVDLELTFLGF